MSRDHAREFELFEQARDLAGARRAEFLLAQCGDDRALRARVERLLAADATPMSELQSPALLLAAADAALWGDESETPERIDVYRILREIGRGGMGVVYEAEQEQPRRRVALKRVRPGYATAATLRRFEHEAQVLGWLNHPGIAQIYAAGTTDSGAGPQPFFAMEFVEGLPLTQWAREHDVDLPGRLRAFAAVCDAVHHAHQKGVVHRDLKPSNILVTADGQPKVLDFGVARVVETDLQGTGMQTQSGQVLGTLPYMSPEQMSADPSRLDARADVYSLGVVLYELLAGTLPHDLRRVALPEAVRIVAQEEPSSLGTHDRALRGDVETIVAKAVAKEPERRYASAEEFAADLRRHLRDEPIVARPASTAYQLSRFARRNRALVGGIAGVILALAVGLAVAVHLYQRAEDQRVAAETLGEREREQRVRAEIAEEDALAAAAAATREAETARRVSGFLTDLFEQGGRLAADGTRVTAADLLDAGAKEIRGELEAEPQIRSTLLLAMGRAYSDLGLSAKAQPLLEEGIELRRAQGIEDDELVQGLSALASNASNLGAHEQMLEVAREAIEACARVHGADAVPTIQRRIDRGYFLVQAGRPNEGFEDQRQGLEQLERILGPDHAELSSTLRYVGFTLVHMGRYAEAEESFERAVAILAEVDPDGQGLPAAQSELAWAIGTQSRWDEALGLFEQSKERALRVYPPKHPSLIALDHGVAAALDSLGRYDEAESLYRAALEDSLEVCGPEHYLTATILDGLALVLLNSGRPEEAEELRRRSVEADAALMGEGHPLLLGTYTRQAGDLIEQGRFAEARELLESQLVIARETYDMESRHTARILGALADIPYFQGEFEAAVRQSREALGIFRRAVPPLDQELDVPLVRLADALVAADDHAGAEPLYLEAYEVLIANTGEGTDLARQARETIRHFYEHWGRLEQAALWREID